jgi:ATP phosphoribosyltransferase regulatory subunit
LGGGGRYDHLMGRFGRTAASTGFALDVDHVFRAIDWSGSVASPRPAATAAIPAKGRSVGPGRQRRRV